MRHAWRSSAFHCGITPSMGPSFPAQAHWDGSQQFAGISWGPLSQFPLNVCIHGQVIYPACHVGLMKMLLWLMTWALPQKVGDPKWVSLLTFFMERFSLFIVCEFWIAAKCWSQEEGFLCGILPESATMINMWCCFPCIWLYAINAFFVWEDFCVVFKFIHRPLLLIGSHVFS